MYNNYKQQKNGGKKHFFLSIDIKFSWENENFFHRIFCSPKSCSLVSGDIFHFLSMEEEYGDITG